MPVELPIVESLSVSLSASQIILGIYFLALGFTAIYSIIFVYHWTKYSIKSHTLTFFSTTVYMTGAAFLLMVMTLALLRYTT